MTIPEKWLNSFSGNVTDANAVSSVGRLLEHTFEHGHDGPDEIEFLRNLQKCVDDPECVRHDTSVQKDGSGRDSMTFSTWDEATKTGYSLVVSRAHDGTLRFNTSMKGTKKKPHKFFPGAELLFVKDKWKTPPV